MRTANRRDSGCMARCGQPVVDRGPDPAALHRRLASAVMAGDQEQEPVAAPDRLLERAVDRAPGGIQRHSVKVEHAIGFDRPAPQPAVPAAIEGCSRPCFLHQTWRRTLRWMVLQSRCGFRLLLRRYGRFSSLVGGGSTFTIKRPDRRRDARPQIGLFRAERAHGQPCPSGSGSGPRPSPTCRPLSRRPGFQRPRRCRTDWVP